MVGGYGGHEGTYSSTWPVTGDSTNITASGSFWEDNVINNPPRTTIVYVRQYEEEKQEEVPLSTKHDYPRVDFKAKTKKPITKPEHVSVNKEVAFINFLTRVA
jgi:hypothetical protein